MLNVRSLPLGLLVAGAGFPLAACAYTSAGGSCLLESYCRTANLAEACGTGTSCTLPSGVTLADTAADQNEYPYSRGTFANFQTGVVSIAIGSLRGGPMPLLMGS